MTNPAEFPWTAQSEFVSIPDQLLPGDVWEGDVIGENITRGLIARVTQVAQVTDVLIAANNASDDVGIYIDGALFSVVAGSSAGATALLLEALLEESTLLASIVSTVTVNTATVRITFSDYAAHTVTEYSPDATTATVSAVTAAVSNEKLRYGYGVARKAVGSSTNTTKIGRPTSASDMFAGVLFRTPSTGLSEDLILALDPDADHTYLAAGFPYSVGARRLGIAVEYVGTAPTMTDSVYWIFSGASAGKFRINDGATSQVTRGDVAFSTTDNVGLIVDGLDPIFVASDTSDDITVAALAAAWNANPAYLAIATASTDVSGAESYIILTFNDDQVHTVTSYSPATADITGITNTTEAVAAVAVLRPELSWGHPSTTTGDVPCAYLRLNNP